MSEPRERKQTTIHSHDLEIDVNKILKFVSTFKKPAPIILLILSEAYKHIEKVSDVTLENVNWQTLPEPKPEVIN